MQAADYDCDSKITYEEFVVYHNRLIDLTLGRTSLREPAGGKSEEEAGAAAVGGSSDRDVLLTVIVDDRCAEHVGPRNHPERPERVTAAVAALRDGGLLDSDGVQLVTEAEEASDEQLAIHSKHHLQQLATLSAAAADEGRLQFVAHDTFICSASATAARLAAGGACQLLHTVAGGQSVAGLSLLRPPGHHCGRDSASGFCLLNNVAVVAHRAVRHYGFRRVLIFDWDVHHGDGTQALCGGHPNMLYMSLHRYQAGRFFPYTGAPEDCCEGTAVNLAWPVAGLGDADYMLAMQHVMLPIAREYAPDLVLISAGFDAARGDPLGGMQLSPAAYAWMTAQLAALNAGQLVMLLEGGYSAAAVADCVAACAAVMAAPPASADACPSTPSDEQLRRCASPKTVDTIARAMAIQADWWKCCAVEEAVAAVSTLAAAMRPRVADVRLQLPAVELRVLQGDWSRRICGELFIEERKEDDSPQLLLRDSLERVSFRAPLVEGVTTIEQAASAGLQLTMRVAAGAYWLMPMEDSSEGKRGEAGDSLKLELRLPSAEPTSAIVGRLHGMLERLLAVSLADLRAPPPRLTAKAALVADARTGAVLWEECGDDSLQIASLTKVMTFLLVLRCLRDSGGDLDDAVVVSARAAAVAGTTASLVDGQVLTVRQLLLGMMLPSGNDAATALAETFGTHFEPPGEGEELPGSGPHYDGKWDRHDALSCFVAEMNRHAAALGMTATRFVNPTGLMHRLHRSSARDVAAMVLAAMRSDVFRTIVSTQRHRAKIDGVRHSWVNTNRLLTLRHREYYVDGVKTGITPAAGGCLATAVHAHDGSRSLIVVTLASASKTLRFMDNQKVIEWAWAEGLGCT
eukprot:PLAT14035.1.p1 GENE.PLAT14035.1~~PLAT14035.1.p1  ORF type:complete len:857 (+),score=463.87 PLAT14035.1:251-2821(+)